MFRKLIVGCAKLYSSKAVGDHFLPWIRLALAVLGAGLVICQYSNDVSIKRVQATLELSQAYRKETENTELLTPRRKGFDMKKEFIRVKCEALQPGFAQIQPMDCTALKPKDIEIVSQTPLPTTGARHEVRRKANKIRADNFQLNHDVDLKRYMFFNVVRVCTQAGNCDTETALALFANDMTTYLNDVCVYAEAPSSTRRKETEILAQFLLETKVDKDIFWSEDEGRENLFMCDYLRELSP